MSRWFRAYDEALDDPKVQRLSAETFRGWFNLLCLASRYGGILPDQDDISFALRLSSIQTKDLIVSLMSVGLLEYNEQNQIVPHNWNGRQYKSDVSTDRVRRFRKRNETVSETANETPPETDTESDTDTESKKEGVATAIAVTPQKNDDCEIAVLRWNGFAAVVGLASVQRLTAGRKSKLKARLQSCGGLDGWDTVLAKIHDSPFLLGDNDRKWRADFDFVVQEKSFTKILEGAYDRSTNPNHSDKRGWIGAALAVGASAKDPPDVFG